MSQVAKEEGAPLSFQHQGRAVFGGIAATSGAAMAAAETAEAKVHKEEKGIVPQKKGDRKHSSLAQLSYNDQSKNRDKNIFMEYVESLSEDERNMFQDEFNMYDKDNDGYITIKELGTVLRSLGEDPSDDELEKMVEEIDANDNNRIEFKEFLIMMAKKMYIIDSEDELIDAFKVFDSDGNGYITKGELQGVFTSLGGTILSVEELDELLTKADADGDGKMNYEEFVKIMRA